MYDFRILLAVWTVFWAAQGNCADLYSSSLEQVEALANKNSPQLKATDSLAQAAKDQSKASGSSLWPKVNLNAGYVHQSDVPGIEIAPGVTRELDIQNIGYVGLGLSYTLFNGFKDTSNSKSAKANAMAKQLDMVSQTRQIKHSVRLAYFRAQLAAENIFSTLGSLKLSQAEYKDVSNRFRAGSATDLEKITMEQEMLSAQSKFQRAQSDFSTAIRNLLEATGDSQSIDLSHPLPKNIVDSIPKNIDEPTAIIELEDIEKTLATFSTKNLPAEISPSLPELKSLEYSSESANYLAEGYKSTYWPSLSLGAQALRFYPHEFLPESLNVVYAMLSWNLFENGMGRHLASQQASLANASEFQRQQKIINLKSDFSKIKDSIKSLWSEEKIGRQSKQKAEQTASLVRKSYSGGRSRLLDVQTANQRLLESQFAFSQVQHQLLIQYSEMDLLTWNEETQKDLE